MAGEWISVDCCLESKPETVEILVATGEPIDVVIGRLVRLWLWAQLNCADGTIKASPAVLARVAGGDEAFWAAVAESGWIEFDGKNVKIAGWEQRFSQAAKRRLLDSRRKAEARKADKNPQSSATSPAPVRKPSAPCPQVVCTDADTKRTSGGLEERRREENRGEEKLPAAQVATSKPPTASSSSQANVISWNPEDGWQGITDADRQEWRTAYPGADLTAELAKSGSWLKANPKRAGKRNWRRFLVGWLQRCQDSGGTNRERGNRPDDKPPPERWLDNYRPSNYRRPREVMELAAKMKRAE